MKFATEKDLTDAVKTIQASKTGKNLHWPPMFKKAALTYMKENNITSTKIIGLLGIANSTLYYWKDQDRRELFTLEGSYCVSQKSKDINSAILTKIQKKIARLQKRMALVKDCSAEGIKVAAEA